MRCDQLVGLNAWAENLVRGCGMSHFTGKFDRVSAAMFSSHKTENFVLPRLEPCVRQDPSGKGFYGAFDPSPLMKYTLRDGRVLYEAVQAEPWSSGPVTFLALADEAGNRFPESLWTNAEIEANT